MWIRLPWIEAAAVLAVSACGGTGPSSTAPQIAGMFIGEATYRSASPDTQCYAQFLRTVAPGHNYNVAVTVQQTSEQILGTLRGTQIQTTCDFSGAVQPGGSARWQQTTCSAPCTAFADGPCPAVRICVANHTFDGQASPGRISGTHNVTWDLFDLMSGDALGRLEITGSIDVRR